MTYLRLKGARRSRIMIFGLIAAALFGSAISASADPTGPTDVATAKSKPAKRMQMQTLDHPLRVQVGALTWREYFGGTEGILTAGASYDIYRGFSGGTASMSADAPSAGVYLDQAGYFQDHSPYRYWGGGIMFRQPISMMLMQDTKPYVGAGVGYYHIDLHDSSVDQRNRVGGKVFAGVDFKEGFYLQISYDVLGRAGFLARDRSHDRRDLNRLSVSVGYRF